MSGEAPFGDAADALNALERDRRRLRLRRRVQRANAWYFPALAAVVALLVASPSFDGNVVPVVVAASLLIPVCTFLYRKQSGVSGRIDTGLSVVIAIAVPLLVVISGLFMASALSTRFGFEVWVPVFAGTTFVLMLGGGFLSDAVVAKAHRAR